MFTMLLNRRFWHLGLISLVVSSIAATVNPSYAQIIPDATLGAESSVITPNVNIKGSPANQIDGGATRGANLFHSFSEFNVSNAGRVYFANPTGIENILTRVTGNNTSSILGTLGVNGNANLFLINSNGIIFGENAKLDIPGSFFASTASSLNFGNGNQFSAANPEAPPLLTINVLPGVQYNHSQPAAIVNRGNLQVGQNLTLAVSNLDLSGQLLAGGNLTLQATDTLRIRDTATVPFIASAGGKMEVEGNVVDIFALNHPNSGFYSGGDMTLISPNPVGGDAHYFAGGNFKIKQPNGTNGNLFSPNDPVIKANGDVILGDYTGASLHILAGGSVTLGDVNITGVDATNFINETITLSDGKNTIDINGSLQSTLDVRAGIDWTLLGLPPLNIISGSVSPSPTFNLNSPVATSADITIGNISNNGGKVFLTNQYRPNPLLLGGTIKAGHIHIDSISADIGSIIIDSRDNIQLIENIGIIPYPYYHISGNIGDIQLIANNKISLINSGLINGSMNPTGSNISGDIKIECRSLIASFATIIANNVLGNIGHGNINIKASDYVELVSSFLGVFNNGEKAGNINISTQKLILQNSRISAISIGNSDAGNIVINAIGSIELNPKLGGFSEISTTSHQSNSGNIDITTNHLKMYNGATINSSAIGYGRGGNIFLNVRNSIEMFNDLEDIFPTRIIANAVPSYFNPNFNPNIVNEGGNAGSINIATAKLIIQNGSSIEARANNSNGNGGEIFVSASDAIEIIGTGSFYGYTFPSQINADTIGGGGAGNITISTKQLTVREGGRLSAKTYDSGQGGILKVLASDYIQLIGTSFDGQWASGLYFDSSGSGNAKGININTGDLIIRDGARVNVSSNGLGNPGDINITANSIFMTNHGRINATTAYNEGGNIKLTTKESIIMRHNSEITTESWGVGNGGNITINAGEFVIGILAENSDIAATAIQGHGGNIFITAKGVFGFSLPKRLVRTSESDISAASELGIGGTETINAQTSIQPNILPSQPLPALAGGRCQAGYQRRSRSSFQITKTNNSPLSYNQADEINRPEVDIRIDNATGEKSDRPAENISDRPVQNSTNFNQLIEAQGFIVNHQGKIELTDVAPVTTLYSSLQSPQTCALQQANSHH